MARTDSGEFTKNASMLASYISKSRAITEAITVPRMVCQTSCVVRVQNRCLCAGSIHDADDVYSRSKVLLQIRQVVLHFTVERHEPRSQTRIVARTSPCLGNSSTFLRNGAPRSAFYDPDRRRAQYAPKRMIGDGPLTRSDCILLSVTSRDQTNPPQFSS